MWVKTNQLQLKETWTAWLGDDRSALDHQSAEEETIKEKRM